MKLLDILKDINSRADSCVNNVEIAGISCNSKAVYKNYLFVAIKGSHFDGHDFVNEAVMRGASAVIVQDSSRCKVQGARSNLSPFTFHLSPSTFHLPPIIEVPDTTIALAQMADNFYNHPSQKLNVIGITGTNGKTTTSYIIENIFESAGYPCGVIGTISYKIGRRIIPATNTTPNALDIQSYLSGMADLGVKFCAMEVSSHSLCQHRVRNINFKVAIFTNLGSDHLDYHKTREDYYLAKLKLFTGLKNGGCAIINIDDFYGVRLLKLLKQDCKFNILTYGCCVGADVYADNIVCADKGARFMLHTPQGNALINSRLLGRHNIYNILASSACASYFDVGIEDIKFGIESLADVRGRLEVVETPYMFRLIIDYAHTNEALESVLSAMNELGLDIILVFGCGGDRDKTKRPLMAKTAAKYAKFIYITSDNPRSEDPVCIAHEIEQGLKDANFTEYEIVIDRQIAIAEALRRAIAIDNQNLCVLIAGKGHETYQVLKDSIVPFDDRDIVNKCISVKCVSVK